MSRLIESIRLEDGRFHRLPYHQRRIDIALRELYGVEGTITLFDLTKLQHPKFGLYKCRVVYDTKIRSVEFLPYEVKPVQSLKVVHSELDYSHKFEDRIEINNLFLQRGECDDILIVRNEIVTDSSYSNIVFFDGNQWVTPHTPLLKGTMRQMLLDTAEIKECPITIQSISSFTSFRLINAMLGFNGPEIEVSKIVF